ncbi:MAG: MMPL family transporter [Planctomycetaceae bacterium]|nr:MMPL family transporter [Planctomycetaceae bacterium]
MARLLVAGRWLWFAIACLMLVVAWFSPPRPASSRSVDQMFGSQDAAVSDFREIKKIFGDRETILVIYRDRDLFAENGRGLQRLANLSQQLEQLPQVEEVLSLDRLEGALRLISAVVYPGSTAEWALLDPQNEMAQQFRATFDGWTHRQDNDLAVLVCLIRPAGEDESSGSTRETIQRIRAVIADIPEAHVVGEPVMVEDAFDYLHRDGLWLQYGSMVLLGLVILLVLRTLRWMLVAAVVVYWSNVITVWMLERMSFQQSMISSLLGSIIAVIGVATTVHLIVGYRGRRLAGDPNALALETSLRRLLPPILWACLTDAAGFGSLAVARVSAVQEFGLMMGLASLVTLLGICLLVPALVLGGTTIHSGSEGLGQTLMERLLVRVLERVRQRPGLICTVTLGVSLAISSGFYFARVETDFTKNFRPGTPILEGYHFAEEEFGGAGLIEISVATPRSLDRDFMAKVSEYQNRLREIRDSTSVRPDVSEPPRSLAKVISLVDVWETTQKFGALRLLPPATLVASMRQVLPQFTDYWYRWDRAGQVGYLRIFLRTRQQQSAEEKRALLAEIRLITEQSFGDSEPTFRISGLFVLLSKIVDSLLDDYLATTLVAIGSIGGLMYLALWNWRLVLIGLVPNLVPIFVLLGGMAWLGFPINMGVAMIAAVSIGLSVDSSLHYLWAVVHQGQECASTNESQGVEWAQQRVGTALTYSTIALVVGFISLTTSEFVPTIYFGGLVSAAMLGGLLGNIMLLPALLAWTEHRRTTPQSSKVTT